MTLPKNTRTPRKNTCLKTLRTRRQDAGENATALDIRQKIIAVCARLSLRLGLEDLLTLARRFLNPNCSKSNLTRALKHYNASRLPVLDMTWPTNPRKNKGTCFYYSRIIFPARFYLKVPMVVDVIVDSTCRMVRLQATAPPHGSALTFIKDTVEQFPIKTAGIIAQSPVFLMSSDPGVSGETRRHLYMLEQFCTIRGITFDTARTIPEATLKTLEDDCRRIIALDHDMDNYPNGRNSTAAHRLFLDQIAAGLDIYHNTPLGGLRNQSPIQTMTAHYQNYPACCITNPN